MSARTRMLAIASLLWLATSLSFAATSSRTASAHAKGLAITSQQNLGQAPAQVLQPVQIQNSYGNLPLAFEANEGQINKEAKFLARGSGQALFFTPNGMTLSVVPPQNEPRALVRDGLPSHVMQSGFALRMRWLNANPLARISGQDELPGKVNYLMSNDRRNWHTNIPTFQRVRYEQLYKGIDLIYYGNHTHLEYDFVVAPGADVNAVQMHAEGVDAVRVSDTGQLMMTIGGEELSWRKPIAYQVIGKKKQFVRAEYVLQGDVVRFDIGSYDHRRALVIDPVLTYSTYVGPGIPTAIAVDRFGSAYLTGVGFTGYPVTPGAFRSTPGIYVTKFNQTASSLIYSTFVGQGESTAIAVDTSGKAFITGSTNADDFPVTSNAYQKQRFQDICEGGRDSSPCPDGFVTKLNANGTGLEYSTYIGGSQRDEPLALTIDSSGNAYITGFADGSYPLTPGTIQSSTGGCIVTKLNSTGSALVFSAKLPNTGLGIAIDSSRNVYVVGNEFGELTATARFGPTDGKDLFAVKMNPTGTTMLYAVVLGGSGIESSGGVAIDSSNNLYHTGWTTSTDFPTTPGAFNTNYAGGDSDVFAVKINPTGSALLFSGFLGGSSGEFDGGVAVDKSGHMFVGGYTQSPDFPTTSNALRRTFASVEGFLAELDVSGSSLLYSSFVGGSSDDRLKALALDSAGNAYISGETFSQDFPTTPGAFRTTPPTSSTSTFLSKFEFANLCPLSTTDPSVTICLPANGATIPSPVRVFAGTTDSHKVTTVQIYIDGSKKYEIKNNFVDAFLGMSAGVHRLTVQAVDSSGQVFRKTISITVPGTSTTCSAPTTARTVHICSPTNGSTVSSPVKISATAKPGSSAIKVMQVYIDGVKKYEKASTNTVSTSLTMSAGAHRVTVQAQDSAGYFRSTVNITVH